MASKRSNPTLKKKKKQWYEIIAPEMFNSIIIGETPAYDIKDCIGRRVKISLMHILHDPRKFHISLEFEITNAAENKTYTKLIGYYLSPSYVKKLVRKGTRKIDDSFLVRTKSAKILEIKPIIITDGNADNRVKTSIIKKTREYIANLAKDKEIDEIIKLLIGKNIQNELSRLLSKIYPIKFAEIRYLKLYKGKYKKERLVMPKEIKEQKPKTEKKPMKNNKVAKGIVSDKDKRSKISTES